MKYCKDALKLLKVKVVCGKDCPIYAGGCPRLILQDANDETDERNNIAIDKAIKAMMEVVNDKKKTCISKLG